MKIIRKVKCFVEFVYSLFNIHKGCSIPDDCVVAANSVVTKTFGESNALIGGVPAKEIKSDIVGKNKYLGVAI